MLTSTLKSSPRFVIFQDNLEQNATEILRYLIANSLKYESHKPLVYYEFEFNLKLNSCGCLYGARKVEFIKGFTEDDDENHAKQFLASSEKNCIIFIDSIGHMIHKFGKHRAYKLLHQLKNDKNVAQIVTVLHKYLFEEEDIVFSYMNNLGTLIVDLLPKFISDNYRASYIYKKSGGKVTTEIEEYYMENGNLVTKTPEKIDALSLVRETTFNPDDLTTFKITLDDKDMESRNKLVLPYLPKGDSGNESKSGGEIFYEFDEVDDWDAEDPDDDLDL